MQRLPKFCKLESMKIGTVFGVPGNPASNVICEYTLVIELPAKDAITKRREYAKVTHGLTVTGVETASAQVHEHARHMAQLMLSVMQSSQSVEWHSPEARSARMDSLLGELESWRGKFAEMAEGDSDEGI